MGNAWNLAMLFYVNAGNTTENAADCAERLLAIIDARIAETVGGKGQGCSENSCCSPERSSSAPSSFSRSTTPDGREASATATGAAGTTPTSPTPGTGEMSRTPRELTDTEVVKLLRDSGFGLEHYRDNDMLTRFNTPAKAIRAAFKLGQEVKQ